VPHSHHTHMDRWRIVIPGHNASEILVLADKGAFVLPEVLVPRNQRLAWHLNEEIKRNWQLPILSIVPVNNNANTGESESAQYHVAEIVPPGEILPPGTSWVNFALLAPETFRDAADFDAVRTFFNPLSSAKEDGPFARVGWFADVSAWVQPIAALQRLEWNGRFEQFHAAAGFSLIRFDTSPSALWFKAVGEPNTREFHITQVLAKHLPDYGPRLLAVRPQCNGWFAEESPGKILHEVSSPDLWRKAASTLAQLQIESIAHVEELLRAGAHRLQAVLSDSATERFVRVGTALLSENPDRGALDPAVDDLAEIASHARELFDRAKTFHIPDALGHLDLNAANVLVSRERCTYLDWAEGYVGYPFLTFEYLLQAFRRTFGKQSPDEARLTETYLTSWARLLSLETVREAWGCTPFLGLFAYTLRCIAASEPYLDRAPGPANYVRSLMHKLKRGLGECRSRTVEVQ
jgi:hypothetical protein